MAANRIKGITVEIGGVVTGLSKSLTGVNMEIKSTQSQLKDVERLLKLDPTNTNLLQQRQRLLAQAVEETKNKLDALKDAEKQVQQQVAEGNASQEQYEGLQREIIATEQDLRRLEDESKNCYSALAKIEDVGSKFSAAGEKITDVGKKVSVVSGVFAPAGAGAAKMSMDFEDAIAKVGTIADTSQVSLGELEKSILDLSDKSGISASEIANNVYDAISAGQSTADAVTFVEKATTLAKAGFAETGNALDILTTIMNAYGLEASEVSKVSDTLIMTQNLGKTTVAELSSAMGKVIPTAKAQNVSLIELSSAYAVMTSNGIATAETTTYLNSMLNELGKQGSSAEKAFRAGTEGIKNGGISMAEAMASGWSLTDVLSVLDSQAKQSGTTISNMFGSAEAGKAASVLIDNGKKFNDVLLQMESSAGATDAAYEKLETTSFKMKKSLNELKNVAIQLGDSLLEALAPIIDAVSEKIKEFSEWFSNLSDSQRELIVKIGLIVAAAGPLLVVIGNVCSAIGSITSAVSGIGPAISFVSESVLPKLQSVFTSVFGFIAANPIVLLIAAIVALVALIATKGDEIQAILQKVDDFLQGVFATDWTKIFGPVLGGILNTFFASIKNIWDSVKQILNGVIDFIRGVFTGDWKRAWNGIVEMFSGIWSGLVSIAKSPINAIIGFINTAIGGVNTLIRGLNKIPGVSIGQIGNIPFLANGGILKSGSAVVGDAGPELLTVIGGKAVVQPLSVNTGKIEGMLGNISGQLGQYADSDIPFVVNLMLDGDVIGQAAFNYNRRRERANGC